MLLNRRYLVSAGVGGRDEGLKPFLHGYQEGTVVTYLNKVQLVQNILYLLRGCGLPFFYGQFFISFSEVRMG
jgi:hypothetical protein